MLKFLIVGVAIATSLIFTADQADAFGGRGYARRHARRAYYAPPVVVRRAYVAPVVHHYRAPVYYRPPVSVNIQTAPYGSYYGSGYYHHGYPSYGGGGVSIYGRGGVSIGIGW
jgi:hypothetical protein